MEYRTFFIVLKLLTNALLPLFILEYKNNVLKEQLVYLLISIISPLVCLCYIFIKKRIYHKTYLYKAYIPNFKLIIFTHLLDCGGLFLFYYKMLKLATDTFIIKVVGAVHGIITLIIYMIIFLQKNRTKRLISYDKHKYRLGILANDFGGANGLEKGQPVEIVEETQEGGYIVKDNRKRTYILEKKDIEEILEIV